MARTGMIARGLRAARRMTMGAASTVYVLAKAAGSDTHERIGSTDSAHQTLVDDSGNLTLQICEDATLDETAMMRASAFALASESDGTFSVYRRVEAASPPLGARDRTWSFTVAPTGEVYDLNSAFSYTFPYTFA